MESNEKVLRPEMERDTALRRVLRTSARSEEQVRELDKDAHLLEACRCGDRVIASNDDTARADFANCAREQGIGWLGRVVWVNPATDSGLVEWLEWGARTDPEKQLSNFS